MTVSPVERTVPIAVIPGDGIGPELVDAAVAVLRAATADGPVTLQYTRLDAGAQTYQRTGTVIADEALQHLRSGHYAALLKGPTGLPGVRLPDGTEAGLLGGVLRTGLDTYAGVRPIRGFGGIGPLRNGGGRIDYVIVRENTEGLYISRGRGVGNRHAASDQLLVTRPGVERVVRFACELARSRSGAPADGVRRVTIVDKSNVLRSYAFFRSVATEVVGEYGDVEVDYRYADAAAHDLVSVPERFDVLVTENFVGDILSDLGAATVGGLGFCGSANIGAEHAYFEPVHGSAPDIAGTGRANPVSQLLSAALLLDHLGLRDAGERIRDAVSATLSGGAVLIDGRGRVDGGAAAVARAVIERLA